MAAAPLTRHEVGSVIELAVGSAAHGGSCVARYQGKVVFVRHALEGELVRARVTADDGGSYFRADAVEILRPAPGRVTAPCPHAGPGKCGGCDWQHASAQTQREIKTGIVIEQFQRLASLDVRQMFAGVTELPGGLLGWRNRITYAVARNGVVGLHRNRSREVEPVAGCLLGVPAVSTAPHRGFGTVNATAIERACGDDGVPATLAHRPGPGRQARGRRPPDRVEVVNGPATLTFRLGDHQLHVAASGFWQVHPQALATYAAELLTALAPRPGERVLDLYAGAGPLCVVLADAVGPTGTVLGVESAPQAVADAVENLRDQPWASMLRAKITPEALAGLTFAPDLVVLDPPRAGAGAAVMKALVELAPRAIAYVACDPAALARDTAHALAQGWRLSRLTAFDAFPMTHHLECIALLEPAILPRA